MRLNQMAGKKQALSQVASARRITGQGMTEYIIIVALIAIAAVVAVSFFGSSVQAQFTQLGNELVGNTGQTASTMVTQQATDAADAAGTAQGLGDYGQ